MDEKSFAAQHNLLQANREHCDRFKMMGFEYRGTKTEMNEPRMNTNGVEKIPFWGRDHFPDEGLFLRNPLRISVYSCQFVVLFSYSG